MVLGQNVGQIMANAVKKSKERGIINSFFCHILHGGYLLKQKEVIAQTPEWKSKSKYS